MARQLLCLAARAVKPPKPEGSRRRREGLTANSARRATMVVSVTSPNRRCVTRCSPVDVSVPCVFDTRRSPFHAMRHSPHQLISGGGKPPTKVPLATVRAQAPRRMGPIYYAAYCSHAMNRSHIHLGSVCSFGRCFSNFVVGFRITLSK